MVQERNPLLAADLAPIEVGQPARLEVFPPAVKLTSARQSAQLVVTGFYADQSLQDLTRAASITSTNPAVVEVRGSVAMPIADGTAELRIEAGGQQATIPVEVSGFGVVEPVSFEFGALVALSKQGCNAGACHGSPSGKGGFRLSLRAFDPSLDQLTLIREDFGRRTNVLEPEQSLLLLKPLMKSPHGGGLQMTKHDPAYAVLRDWIAEGARPDPPGRSRCVKLEVYPGGARLLKQPAHTQQLAVIAHFSDGTSRDVTPLAAYSSSDDDIASATPAGLVVAHDRGEAAILVRYLEHIETVNFTFVRDIEGFAWNDPPAANYVDEHVYAKLRQLQYLPSDTCTDAEFLRRVYLDVIGVLPTIEETETFLADTAADKRARLIDALLERPEYAKFWALKWGDLLRLTNGQVGNDGVFKYHRWVERALRDNVPYDQFARELLTASGSTLSTPPANFYRTAADMNDCVETISQIFLGARLQCAKCHNHPFERWTQDNYYGIAAAFARIDRKPGVDPTEEVVFVKNSGDVTQPRTGKVMKTHLLLKGDVDVPADADRRAVFAEWLTQPDNPFFAKAAVNRVWGHLMGRGIVEPVDDFRDSNPPSNAPLLDKLASEFAAHNFSIKWAVREIMKSRTYQLSSRKNDFNGEDEIYASHAVTRMLTAEQLLDGICQVTGVPENFPGQPVGTRATELPDPPTDHYFLKIFGQPQREMACQCERSSESNLSQALQMINGPVVHNKLRDDNGRINQLIVAGKSDEEIITTLYQLALARDPAPSEMEASKKHIAGSSERRPALEDIGWALLNSKEFLFQH
ncbi:MAG: DUF1553 domain-containing protein [Planctomycetales bacterium]|nr:DUF1553 domain-containing protein [Planctomycetales bacterium]